MLINKTILITLTPGRILQGLVTHRILSVIKGHKQTNFSVCVFVYLPSVCFKLKRIELSNTFDIIEPIKMCFRAYLNRKRNCTRVKGLGHTYYLFYLSRAKKLIEL